MGIESVIKFTLITWAVLSSQKKFMEDFESSR